MWPGGFRSFSSLESEFIQIKLTASYSHSSECIYMCINYFLRKKVLNSNFVFFNWQQKMLGEEDEQLGKMWKFLNTSPCTSAHSFTELVVFDVRCTTKLALNTFPWRKMRL